MLFACPGSLGNAVAAEGTGYRLVGIDGIAVHFYVRYAVGPGRRQAASDADRRTLFRVGSRPPIDRHLSSHQRAIFLDAALDVDDRFMPCER